MALFTGITNTQKIGGIFGLSCYLPLSDQVKVLIPEDCPNKQTPIFMGHGTADMILQCDFGKKSADYLKELGHDVEFRTYPFVLLFLFSFGWIFECVLIILNVVSLDTAQTLRK
jgi:predicted esterase